MKTNRPMGVGEGDLELEMEYAQTNTRQRNDNNGTQFETWRRRQPHLDSGLGYLATDVDFIWRNYKTKQFMFVEEKCKMSTMTGSQYQTFKLLDEHMSSHPDYMGFHLLQFENTSPEDGKIYWNKEHISLDRLNQILTFKNINELGYFRTVKPKFVW